MVTLRKLRENDRVSVLGLAVTDSQSAFVEPLAETLSANAPRHDNFVITAGDDIVGFFQIDSTSGAQKIPGTLELHEVSIDARRQGKGFGRAFIVALRTFLQDAYPDAPAVCLTVNCRNRKAYRLYQLGGFEDTGDLHHEGRSGPQHIMLMSLT